MDKKSKLMLPVPKEIVEEIVEEIKEVLGEDVEEEVEIGDSLSVELMKVVQMKFWKANFQNMEK